MRFLKSIFLLLIATSFIQLSNKFYKIITCQIEITKIQIQTVVITISIDAKNLNENSLSYNRHMSSTIDYYILIIVLML